MIIYQETLFTKLGLISTAAMVMLWPGVMATATRYDCGICDGGNRPVYECDQYRPNRTLMAMAGIQRLMDRTLIIQRGNDANSKWASDRSNETETRHNGRTVKGGGTKIVCTSDAERWRIGRSIKYAERAALTTFRRRLRADRSAAAAASESAYCVCVCVTVSAHPLWRGIPTWRTTGR